MIIEKGLPSILESGLSCANHWTEWFINSPTNGHLCEMLHSDKPISKSLKNFWRWFYYHPIKFYEIGSRGRHGTENIRCLWLLGLKVKVFPTAKGTINDTFTWSYQQIRNIFEHSDSVIFIKWLQSMERLNSNVG